MGSNKEKSKVRKPLLALRARAEKQRAIRGEIKLEARGLIESDVEAFKQLSEVIRRLGAEGCELLLKEMELVYQEHQLMPSNEIISDTLGIRKSGATS